MLLGNKIVFLASDRDRIFSCFKHKSNFCFKLKKKNRMLSFPSSLPSVDCSSKIILESLYGESINYNSAETRTNAVAQKVLESSPIFGSAAGEQSFSLFLSSYL